MERETVEKEIGGFTYRTTKLGAKRGMRLMVRIVQIMGAAIQGLAGGDAAFAAALTNAMKPGDVLEIAEELAGETRVLMPYESSSGPALMPRELREVFDDHFVDRYDDMVEFIAWAVSVNFGKSLMRGKGIGPRLQAIVSPFLSPST